MKLRSRTIKWLIIATIASPYLWWYVEFNTWAERWDPREQFTPTHWWFCVLTKAISAVSASIAILLINQKNALAVFDNLTIIFVSTLVGFVLTPRTLGDRVFQRSVISIERFWCISFWVVLGFCLVLILQAFREERRFHDNRRS